MTIDDLVEDPGRSTSGSTRSFPTVSVAPSPSSAGAFPDRPQILELSTRSAPDQALSAAARMAAVLTAHGIELTDRQQTKTRAALDFFSGRRPGATGLESGRGAA